MLLTHPLSTVAKGLLDDTTFDIEFHGFLSNHAKHAIIALDRLEAPPSRVQEYWDQYTTLTPYNLSLHKVDTEWSKIQPATMGQWKEWRGEKVGWQEQVALMNQELNERFVGNTDLLIKEYATAGLLSGLAGALTHGIIHLGWAIDAADSPWMITEGLAYLNFCHLGVDESKFEPLADCNDSTLYDSLTRVAHEFESQNLAVEWVQKAKDSHDETFHAELVPAGFQWHLSKVLHEAHPVATKIPSWLLSQDDDEKLWESLYRSVVSLYLATRDQQGNGNFIVLHAITALWSLEQTLRVVNDKDVTRRALSQYYSSVICLLATGGYPTANVLEKQRGDDKSSDKQDCDWDPIVKRGIAEEEEHNIKLVYVCKELWKRFGQWSGFFEAAKSFTLTPNIGPSWTAFD